MYVYINGRFVGYSQGSKTPAEFNITDFVETGENLIALQMYRWSDASYLESQDMLRMSGIEREVYLHYQPKTAISDFQVIADLENNFKNGQFVLTSIIANSDSIRVIRLYKVQLFDGDKKIVNYEENIEINPNNSKTVQFKSIIDKVKQWSAEIPDCYQLNIQLLDQENEKKTSTSYKILVSEIFKLRAANYL